ncbi:unnamed protein product [Effrenium voratum]|uniref:EF-hand domain-containing protein n=1 Tax=Effrenium voratum TaxID=2562239 RepID=A0AA36IFQ5_9DINO|nr:unnamed protein product [Effrenium voratum]
MAYAGLFEAAAREDGAVSTAELQEFLHQHDMKVSEDRLKSLMKEMDDNESGFLELDEFLILLIRAMGMRRRRVGPDFGTASELRQEGWTVGELKKANYDCAALREAGCSAAELMDVCTAKELLNGGVPVLGALVVLSRGISAGSRGVVLDVDRDAGCCRVALEDQSSVPVKVAIRHLAPDPDFPLARRQEPRPGLAEEEVEEALADAIQACAEATSSAIGSTVRQALWARAGQSMDKDLSRLGEQLSRRMARMEERIEAIDRVHRRGPKEDATEKLATEKLAQRIARLERQLAPKSESHEELLPRAGFENGLELRSLEQQIGRLSAQMEDVAKWQNRLEVEFRSLATARARPDEDYEAALRKLTSNMEEVRLLMETPRSISPRRSRASSPGPPAGSRAASPVRRLGACLQKVR